ncbi:MAG TPA: lysozyme inhibitor LprI family protein [Allosphingosinicella sp.]|jgi:uncharacterized protein
MSRLIVAGIAALVCFAALGSAGTGQQRRPLKLDRRGEPYAETATSFDCSKATGRVERMICGDRILAMQDGAMGESFGLLKRNLPAAQRSAVVQSQRAWVAGRDRCAERQCVEDAYEQRLKELGRMSDARLRYLRRNVVRVGQCETTRIQSIGPRLQRTEGDPPSGTSVTLTDGVSVVSYDRIAAIISSHVGDPALVCLMSVPQGCPPGDARGRVYRVTNLRTRRQWQLPDAEHECGGA